MEGPRKLGERCFTLARQLQSGAITPDAAGEQLNDIGGSHMALLAQMQHVLDLIVEHSTTRARHALAAILVAGDES